MKIYDQLFVHQEKFTIDKTRHQRGSDQSSFSAALCEPFRPPMIFSSSERFFAIIVTRQHTDKMQEMHNFVATMIRSDVVSASMSECKNVKATETQL